MDTRTELAAQALCEMDGREPEGAALDAARVEAARFVRLLDAVTPRPTGVSQHMRLPAVLRRGGIKAAVTRT